MKRLLPVFLVPALLGFPLEASAQLSGEYESQQQIRRANQNNLKAREAEFRAAHQIVLCGTRYLAVNSSRKSAYIAYITDINLIPYKGGSILNAFKKMPGTYVYGVKPAKVSNVKFLNGGRVSWDEAHNSSIGGYKYIESYEFQPAGPYLYSRYVSFSPPLRRGDANYFVSKGNSSPFQITRQECNK